MSIRKLLFGVTIALAVSTANCAVAHAAQKPDEAIAAESSEAQFQTEDQEVTEGTQETAPAIADAEKDKNTDKNADKNTAEIMAVSANDSDGAAKGTKAGQAGQAVTENEGADDLVLFSDSASDKVKAAGDLDANAADEIGKEEIKDTDDAKKADTVKETAEKKEQEEQIEQIDQKEKAEEKPKDTEASEKKAKKAEKEKKPSYTEEDLRLLTTLVYAEAGNQSYKGKLAVANVVLNRKNNTQSHMFGHANTIKAVIYDKKWGVQFSVTKGGNNSMLAKAIKMYETGKYPNKAEKAAMKECEKAAKAALEGENNIGSYLFFRMYNKATAKKYTDNVVIEDHIFYNAN